MSLCNPLFRYEHALVDLRVCDLEPSAVRCLDNEHSTDAPKLISMARPPRQTTQRESPAFATNSCRSRSSVSTAVQPLEEPGSLSMSSIPRSVSSSSSSPASSSSPSSSSSSSPSFSSSYYNIEISHQSMVFKRHT